MELLQGAYLILADVWQVYEVCTASPYVFTNSHMDVILIQPILNYATDNKTDSYLYNWHKRLQTPKEEFFYFSGWHSDHTCWSLRSSLDGCVGICKDQERLQKTSETSGTSGMIETLCQIDPTCTGSRNKFGVEGCSTASAEISSFFTQDTPIGDQRAPKSQHGYKP